MGTSSPSWGASTWPPSRSGHPELVDEVTVAVTSSLSYEEALARIMEYVEVE